jgi:serine/threonine protein kinase/Tol biopolymer transport system component
MTLRPGTQIGPYEITAALGAGGMGEVYRARDTKLDREAAIKVLPETFGQDADGVARLRREAHVLASLNHPHIASIYGLEEKDDILALALELVEGEDLARRLERGAIPVDEAIGLARQIVDGLDAAHEKGVVRRDLKPSNVKLTGDGTVKILDFGLAKEYRDDAGLGNGDSSQSPTVARFGTEAGVLLGTAAYMSPEQARGKPVDKRADIWAFGVVLYEMLTGVKLLAGETLSDTLAAVLTREPDWTRLPPSTPAGVRRLLARCLERDPRKRLRDIGDARADLHPVQEPEAPRSAPRRSIARLLPWGLTVLALLLAGWALSGRRPSSMPAREVTHVDIDYPPAVEPILTTDGAIGISPDGRAILMTGWRDGVRRLFVRPLDRAEAIEIPGSSGALSGAFSPDGGSVVFIPLSGAITRLSLTDQQRKVVATGADLPSSLAWSPRGIVFSKGGALWIVSPEGGPPRALTELDAARGEIAHGQPTVLPGELVALFTRATTKVGEERIEALPIDGGKRRVVVERATSPVWSPTGHLLFARDGAVFAAAFDPVTATVHGEAVPVIPSGTVEGFMVGGALGLGLSSTGTLLYVPAGFQNKRLVSVGRDGAALDLGLPSDCFDSPRVSPDGHRLLVGVNGRWLEVLDLARGTRARLTGASRSGGFATWNADGSRVLFRELSVLSWAAADGSGESAPVPAATANDFPSAPGPDPDSFLLVRIQPDTAGDVFLMSISGAFEPRPLIESTAYDGGPQLSPDERWLLYQSDASGRHEIYVRRYPELDRPWQASQGGGLQARWSQSGRELYYRNGREFVAVSFDGSGGEPVLGKPEALFPDDYELGRGSSIANYDATPDGRFIVLRRDPSGNKLRVVFNWTEELKRILAAGGVR